MLSPMVHLKKGGGKIDTIYDLSSCWSSLLWMRFFQKDTYRERKGHQTSIQFPLPLRVPSLFSETWQNLKETKITHSVWVSSQRGKETCVLGDCVFKCSFKNVFVSKPGNQNGALLQIPTRRLLVFDQSSIGLILFSLLH